MREAGRANFSTAVVPLEVGLGLRTQCGLLDEVKIGAQMEQTPSVLKWLLTSKWPGQ